MHSISNKLLAGALAAGMMISSVGTYAATNIGTGSVVGSGALTSSVVWNDTFTTGSATGVVNGLLITAQVTPVLNMTISGSGIIALGNLSSAVASTGSVNIEVGTNAVNGASVTARSTKGGLQNASSASTYINSLTADEVADSYKFLSTLGGTDDSSYASFTETATLNTEVSDNTTNHILYTSNKPQQINAINDFAFSVAAKPSIETPAGNYSDLVVITVTGNF
jgi:hypothetical protein